MKVEKNRDGLRVRVAERHATRVDDNGYEVYMAGQIVRADEVSLLGLRPSGASGKSHRAGSDECRAVCTESERLTAEQYHALEQVPTGTLNDRGNVKHDRAVFHRPAI